MRAENGANQEIRMQFTIAPALVLALAAGATHAQTANRGQLLYSTHCVECHTSQMHWRAQRLARDWDSLREQVTRWQGTARLQWSADDIDAVTRHLNDTVYRFPRSQALLAP
jgi:hypothetical protein